MDWSGYVYNYNNYVFSFIPLKNIFSFINTNNMYNINIKISSIKYYKLFYVASSKNSKDLISNIKYIFGIERSTFFGWLKDYNSGVLIIPKIKHIRKRHKLNPLICSFIWNGRLIIIFYLCSLISQKRI